MEWDGMGWDGMGWGGVAYTIKGNGPVLDQSLFCPLYMTLSCLENRLECGVDARCPTTEKWTDLRMPPQALLVLAVVGAVLNLCGRSARFERSVLFNCEQNPRLAIAHRCTQSELHAWHAQFIC